MKTKAFFVMMAVCVLGFTNASAQLQIRTTSTNTNSADDSGTHFMISARLSPEELEQMRWEEQLKEEKKREKQKKKKMRN